ncbi:hypothetical protein Tco_0709523, partial [Tanacetum coccineum]
AFWGADDEEISEGGIPRVIVLGYDGLPLQPVAPPSPDFMLGPEDPQTPPVPQDEDEREPMFIQAHDPDYPLPPIDSPTTESPGYVTESDPEEDPEEYEDDETEDGPVDYPMDGGDDGDDDDGDSSGDDARDEDKDEEDDEDEEEEEEHLAPADSTVVPADRPAFPPEGTEPVIPPPSTDITIGARITIRPQTSISLPPEAEVERLLNHKTTSITITILSAIDHTLYQQGSAFIDPGRGSTRDSPYYRREVNTGVPELLSSMSVIHMTCKFLLEDARIDRYKRLEFQMHANAELAALQRDLIVRRHTRWQSLSSHQRYEARDELACRPEFVITARASEES